MSKKRRKPQGARRPNKPYSMRKQKLQQPRKRVLIVDDDELLLRAACRLLQDEWDIDTARSAADAATILKEKSFDAVITDYEMPGKDGLWLLTQVKKSNPNTRRVLYSGIGPSTLPKYLASGLVGRFITKPSCRADLLSALNS